MPEQQVKTRDGFEKRLLVGDRLGTSNPPPWFIRSYEEFRENVLHPAYPCYFGTVAEKQGDLYYTYASTGDIWHLPKAAMKFLEISAQFPNRRNNLAVFFKPEGRTRSHEFYRRSFWNTLQFLHDYDPVEWPEDIPEDPEDPMWQFCFGGMAFFIFAAAPSYSNRRSRNLGPGMVLLFQPRDVFDGIEGDTPAGLKARQTVRERLRAWDNFEPHPNMGIYGDPSNNEWKQYFFPDDSEAVPAGCPLSIGLKERESAA